MKKIIKELIPIMSKKWPDWKEKDEKEEEIYGDVINDVIEFIGEISIKKFIKLGWQEQDEIISVLQAIREREV